MNSVNYGSIPDTQDDSGAKSAKSRSLLLKAAAVSVVVLSLVAVCGIAIGVGVHHTRKRPSGLSSDTTVTQEQLRGEYYNGSVGDIHFSSTVNDTYTVLSITTASGHRVVHIVHLRASNTTMISINDTDFYLMERDQQGHVHYDDYVIPRQSDTKNLMESVMSGNAKMSDDVLQMLDKKTVNEARQSVLYSLAISYEATLIIEAAQALGDRNIMGMDYPPVMIFYRFALYLKNARDISAATVTAYKAKNSFASDSRGSYQYRQKQARGVHCDNGATCPSYDRCPSKKYDSDCFGMCGPDCWCWTFVCGDCCIHQYCYTHDLCCYNAGFWTWTCFSVAFDWWFSSCDDTFRC